MSDNLSHPSLSPTLAKQIDRAFHDFEVQWKSPTRPRIEDFLTNLKEPNRSQWLRELLIVEWQLRFRAGEKPTADEYLPRFPEYAEIIRDVACSSETHFVSHGEVRAEGLNSPEHPGSRQTSEIQDQRTDDSVSVLRDPVSTVAWKPATNDAALDDKFPDLPDYEILGVLGRGGMGVVYQALDLQLKRTVAIKMIRAGAHAHNEELLRFRVEAEAIARLQHPHIVQIYAIGEHEDLPFVVLEFLDGGSLRQQLDGNPLPSREAARIVEILARAMQVAHDHGIIHRDLKPANVLLTTDSIPKISDFGLAKRVGDESGQTQTGDIMGTPSYMSPEQALGDIKTIGPATDIYALGAILFELLTGRAPFKAATPIETLRQVLDRDPFPPCQLNSAIDRDLETITLKCLDKDPTRRYPSCLELADDLRRNLSNEPVLARPISRIERIWRWSRRNPIIAVLAASLVLAFVGGFLGVTRQWRIADAAATSERAAVSRLTSQQGELITAKNAAQHNEHEARLAREREKTAKEAAAQLAQRFSYHSHLATAHRALLGGRLNQVHDVLALDRSENQKDDLRGFEWYYLWNLSHQDRMTLDGHQQDLTSVAFSPDATMVATASEDQTVRLWDAVTGRERFVFRGHTGEVHCVCFSPSDRIMATGCADKTVRLWDTSTGQCIVTLEGHTEPVYAVRFAPDGSKLVSGGGAANAGSVKVWNVPGGRELLSLPGHHDAVHHIEFSPDGKLLATATQGDWVQTEPSRNEIKIWDSDTFQERRTIQTPTATLIALVFSADSRTLITGGNNLQKNATVLVWDIDKGVSRAPFKFEERFMIGMAVSPDGQRFAVATGQDVTIRDFTTGNVRSDLKGHWGLIASMAFSPDGRTLATAAKSGDHSAKLWDLLAESNPMRLPGHTGFVSCVALSPDGKMLASASRTLQVPSAVAAEIIQWNPNTGEKIRTLPVSSRDIYSLAFSPDGKLLAASGDDRIVMLWDAASGESIGTLEGHKLPVTRIAFSPDGHTLASSDGEVIRYLPTIGAFDIFRQPGQVKVWNIREARLRETLRGFSKAATAIAFAPSGEFFVTGGGDGTVRVWNTQSFQPIHEIAAFSRFVSAVVFSPNGQLLAVAGVDQGPSEIGDIKLFEVGNWIKKTLIGHGNVVNTLAFTSDSATLASGSWDGTIRLWDPLLGLQRLVLPRSKVNSLVFSADATRLISGDTDSTVRIFRAATEADVISRESRTSR